MVQIKLSHLNPNKYNPRELFRGAAMEELKTSMKDGGLIQPILVRPLKNEKHEVVAGMRRYFAAKDLGWESIDCHVRDLNNFEAMLLAYSENVLRENLTPLELGRMYKNLYDVINSNEIKISHSDMLGSEFEKLNKQGKMEKLTNRSYSTTYKYISLLNLPEELQNLIELNHGDRTKGFAVSYGFELARLPTKDIMEFYKLYNPKDYSVEQYNKKISERLAENKLEGEKKKKKQEANLDKAQLELEKLIQRKEAFEERINKNLEKLEGEYNIGEAIEFLSQKLEEFQSEEKLNKLARDIKSYEHQVDDLDVLLVRIEEENRSICPYCLAKIDIAIINKRKELFEGEIKNLRNELKQINSSMDFNRVLKKDLEDDNDLLIKVKNDIEKKEKEIKDIENELSKS